MATDTTALRSRIDACVKKRAALEERKRSATEDLNEAEAALKAMGYKPATARAAIEKAEEELATELAEVEKQLGIS